MATPTVGQAGSPGLTPAQQDDVNRFHALMGDQGFLGHDRHDHVEQASRLLQGLNPGDLHAVLNAASPDDLKRLGDNADAGGILGFRGLSADERRDLFNAVARNGSGQDAARLANNFGREDSAMLADGVARFGTDAAKIGFIQGVASHTTDNNPEVHTHVGGSDLVTGSPQAQAAGTVLASLKGHPAAMDQALGSLSDTQLRAVTQAAEGQTTHTDVPLLGGAAAPASVSSSYDTTKLAAILDAGATGQDPAQKARLFQAGVKAIGDINDNNTLVSPNPTANHELDRTTNALTDLLASDTTGIVENLRSTDRTGHSLVTYTKEMLSEHKTGALGESIKRLQSGNDGQVPPTQFLDQAKHDANGQPYFDNARNLGYFAGAIQTGVNKITSDAKAQGDLIGNIFTTAASAGVGLFAKAPVAAKVGVTIGNGLTKQIITNVVSQVNAGEKSVGQAMLELATPHDPRTGKPVQLASDTDFNASFAFVTGANP